MVDQIAVRNLLNIKQEDLNYNRDWVVIDIELLKPNQLTDKAIQICDSERLEPLSRLTFHLEGGNL